LDGFATEEELVSDYRGHVESFPTIEEERNGGQIQRGTMEADSGLTRHRSSAARSSRMRSSIARAKEAHTVRWLP
jgi:hypothetical protein